MASLKIGDRVPVATGSFQPGIGGVGINPLVNTQFQYLDVGVNIDITPKVHAGREVTLKISMDISSVTGQSNIGGISQPVIGQRKIEHEIRLKEGEVNIMGGILEDQDIRSLSGIPGLAQIPILKYLFAQSNVEHKENEIVFALIPHVIRARDVTDLNEKALEVGTAAAIQLRTSSAAQAPVRVNETATAAAQPQAAAPAQPSQPAAQPAGAAAFAFDPASRHPGARFNLCRQHHAPRGAKRVLGAFAGQLRSQSVASGECVQRGFALAGRPARSSCTSRRRYDRGASRLPRPVRRERREFPGRAPW